MAGNHGLQSDELWCFSGLGHVLAPVTMALLQDLTLSPSAFPGHQMLHLQSRASGGTDPGVSCRIAASFYLEKVGLTGELLTELLNFLFGKTG